MQFFRPIFCDKDPELAAQALDNETLLAQIASVTILALAVEAKVFQTWTAMKARDPGFEFPYPATCEADYPIPYHILTAYGHQARMWACGSEPAANWLFIHANALITEGQMRGLLSFHANLVKAIHCCLVRSVIYARAFRGNKAWAGTEDLPRVTPEHRLIQRDRTKLADIWVEQDDPQWSCSPPPPWKVNMLVKRLPPVETLVDRSSLQA
jgi:hypothetical protein